MAAIKVTVLGCGGSAGVPSPGGDDGLGVWGECDPAEPHNRRTRSSIVIEGPGGRLLVDTSPDMRGQLLACAIPSVQAILITHAHADHIGGFDDVRLLNRASGEVIPLFATGVTMAELEQRFAYAFRPWIAGSVFYRPVVVSKVVAPGEIIEAAGLRVRLFEQDHQVMPTLGLRVNGFAYSTDVVRLDEAAFAALAGIDTWLVGCFQRDPHPVHADLALVLEWRARLGVRRTVLTHLGPDMDFGWLSAHLPAGVEVAVDGMCLPVG